MSIIDLVARWTTESCHTSIRLSMCGDYHYDNTMFSHKLRTDLWSIKSSRSAVFLKIHLCEKKTKRSLVGIFSFLCNVFCEQQEEERWKEADNYTASTRCWLQDVTNQNFDTYQN